MENKLRQTKLKKNFLKFLILMSFFSSFAQASIFVRNPAKANGGRILFTPFGKTSGDRKGYCDVILQCKYNYNGCTVGQSFDLFTASSNPDGVCKELGYRKSVSFSKGSVTNPFGQFLTLDQNGNVTDITQHPAVSIKSRFERIGSQECASYDPARRSFVIESKSTLVYTSITCD